MWNWRTLWTNRRVVGQSSLRLEELESREVPAITIQIDYSYDTGFFANPAARAVMEQAAAEMGSSLSANLSAITPSGGNTWVATFFNPTTGAQTAVPNLTIGANTIKVFVGAGILSGPLAVGSTGGTSASGSSDWVNAPQTRGRGGFSTWGGDIEFDSGRNWYFGQTTAGLTSSQYDFYSVALHELGRVLGVGTSNQWFGLSWGGAFHGASATSVYGGPVPETSSSSGWADGLTVNGQQASMDPSIMPGVRVNWTALDAAALADLGWNQTAPVGVVDSATASPVPNSPASSPASPTVPPATPVPPAYSFTSANGTLTAFALVNDTLVPTGVTFTPFPGYHGEVRVAAGDFNGDGVADYAFATGVGATSVIEIINGRDGSFLVPPTALFGSYSGGLYLAAGDIDHNGRDQLVIAAGDNAPPIVMVYQVSGGGLQLQTSFVAFDAPWFTGGIRVAVGDLNRDGYADVVVTTASQIGAVVAYSGAELAQGRATELFPMFIPLPGSPLGFNVAVGDLNGDGYADLTLTFASGSTDVMAVWSGAALARHPGTPLNQVPVMSLLTLPPNLTGPELTTTNTGNGRVDLVVTDSSTPTAHLFEFT